MCVCMCVCSRGKEREGERRRKEGRKEGRRKDRLMIVVPCEEIKVTSALCLYQTSCISAGDYHSSSVRVSGSISKKMCDGFFPCFEHPFSFFFFFFFLESECRRLVEIVFFSRERQTNEMAHRGSLAPKIKLRETNNLLSIQKFIDKQRKEKCEMFFLFRFFFLSVCF